MTTVAYAVVVEHANGKVEYVGPFETKESAEDWAHNNKPTWLDWVHTIPLTAATTWLVA